MMELAADELITLLKGDDPPAAFAWSRCSYSLSTPDGTWPVALQMQNDPQLSMSMERLPSASCTGWTWHKNHQIPRLNVSCGAIAPEGWLLQRAD